LALLTENKENTFVQGLEKMQCIVNYRKWIQMHRLSLRTPKYFIENKKVEKRTRTI